MKHPDISHFVQEGRVWRAKEILQGRISSAKFDPELLQSYGEVLLIMGDKVEAGRHLFCSGVRSPEYEEAIYLFLDRYSRKRQDHFFSALPKMIRRHGELKEVILSELFEKNGYTSSQIERLLTENGKPQQKMQIHSRQRILIDNFIPIVFGIFIFCSILVGSINILSYFIESISKNKEDCVVVIRSACAISPSHASRSGK